MTRQEILSEFRDLLKKAKSELPEDDYQELLIELEEDVTSRDILFLPPSSR